jgi:hypothetical protein
MGLELEIGSKLKVRRDYTVQIGGDILQGGEIISVNSKNLPELELQRWKLENTSANSKDRKKITKKTVDESMVENRAITEPITSRAILKKEK